MRREKYFTLSQNCLLVKGTSRGAIYNLNSGKVFSVNSKSVKIIEQLNSGKNLKEILRKSRTITKEEIIVYLNKLEALSLGKWNGRYKKEIVDVPELANILRFVLHLELTTGCNLRCLHCYNKSEIIKFHENNKLSIDDWKRVITEAYKIGARRVQFIGGEPFLRRKLIFELIPYVRDIGYKSLEVSSNGTFISNSDLKKLKEHNVDLAFSFYCSDPNIHDSITTKRGSQEKTLRTIKKVLEMNICLRVSVVAMKQNEKEIKKTVESLKSFGIQHIKTNVIEPVGRGCGDDLITADILEQQILDKPSFFKINYNTFWRNRMGHNCFLEQICIGANGDVYPCLAEREISYGNVKSASLDKIFSSRVAQKFRNLNKDNIEVCRDCEYRYCCFDCRVKAKDFLVNSSHAKPWWCFYDPHKGQWSKKIN